MIAVELRWICDERKGSEWWIVNCE